eukprot:8853473-Prorocentrum_lima.AAC.1
MCIRDRGSSSGLAAPGAAPVPPARKSTGGLALPLLAPLAEQLPLMHRRCWEAQWMWMARPGLDASAAA